MGSDRAKLFTRCCYAAVSIVALSVMFWIAWCLFGLTAVHVAEPQRRAIVHYSPTPSSPTEETSASNAISKLPTTSSLAKELAKGDFSHRDKNYSTSAERAGDLKPVRIPTASPKKGPASDDSEEVLQARRVSSAAFENRPEEKVDTVPGSHHEIAPTRTLPQPETESRVYAIRDDAVHSKRDDSVQSSRRVGDDVPMVDRVPEFVKGETRRRIVSRPAYDDDDERGSKGRYGSAADRGRESDEQYSKGDTRVYPDEVKFKEDRSRKGDEDEDDRYTYRDERPRPAGDTADDSKRLRDEDRYKTRDDERYRDRDDERYKTRDDERYRDRDDERYRDRDVDKYRDRDDDRYRYRDDDRYRHRDDDRYRYRDEERYRYRDDERYRDRDVDRYKDRDDDKLRDRDVDRYRDRDSDKLKDRNVDMYRDRDIDKLKDRDIDRYKYRDDDKIRERDTDRYRDRDEDKLRNRDDDRYKDRIDDKYKDRDGDRYRVRDDDRYRHRDEDRYRDRDDDRYRDRDKDRYRDRDDDRYRYRDDDRYKDRDDDRDRPRYLDEERLPIPDDDDKYGYRGRERYRPRDDDEEYEEKRYPVREDDRHRSRTRVGDDDIRDRSEKRGYRPRELSSTSVPESRTSEDILPPRNTAIGERKPTTSSRYESSLRTEETVTDYDIPVRPYDDKEERDRKRSRDDEERRPFSVGISPTRTRDESYSSRLTRSRGYDDDKRTDYMSRPRDEDRTIIQGSRRSSSEKEATKLYTSDRDRSRPVESTRQYSDRREEVVLDRRSYADEDEYRKGSRRYDEDRRQIDGTRRIYEEDDDRYSRRRDRIDETDDSVSRRRDSYDDRLSSSRPVRRFRDEDDIPSRRDPDRDVRIEDSRYDEKGNSRSISSVRDDERSYSRNDGYRPSRTYTDEDSLESGRRSRRPTVTREPPFVLSTTSPRDPSDSVTREKRYQDREPPVRPLSAKDVIEAANRQSDTSESNARQVFYPVFDPRLSNLTSPEVIQPSERRGTTITLRRRKRRNA